LCSNFYQKKGSKSGEQGLGEGINSLARNSVSKHIAIEILNEEELKIVSEEIDRNRDHEDKVFF
jgi:hypothetical protein